MPSPLLSISARPFGDHTVVEVVGELDLSTIHVLRDNLHSVCSGSPARVLVDLSRLRFCDAAGLDTLLAAYHHITGAGGSLSLVDPQRAVSRLLHVTELDRHFPTFPTLTAAVTESRAGNMATPPDDRSPHRHDLGT